VNHVGAPELELDRLSLLEPDLLGLERELPGRDGDHAGGRLGPRVAGGGRKQSHDRSQAAQRISAKHVAAHLIPLLHQSVAGFSSWAKPSVPECWAIVSSTSFTATSPLPPVRLASRSPRPLNG